MSNYIIAFLLLCLSGCGSGGSDVSTNSGVDNETAEVSVFTKMKRYITSMSFTTTTSVPADVLITEALAWPIPPSEYQKLDNWLQRVYIYGDDHPNEIYAEVMGETTIAKILNSAAESCKKTQSTQELCQNLEGDKLDKLLTANRYYYFRELITLGRGQALTTWPKSINTSSVLFHRDVILFASAMDFSNAVYAIIINQLDGEVMKNPTATKERILKIYESIPLQKLDKIWDKVYTAALAAHWSPNLTGSAKGVEFTGNGATYRLSSDGETIHKNGGTWFGNGYVNGKKYDFSLESTDAIAAEKASGTEQKSGTTTKSGSDNNASVK